MSSSRRIVNPATLEVLAELPDSSPDDVRRACARAAEAQKHWRRLPARERGKLLHQNAGRMRENPFHLAEFAGPCQLAGERKVRQVAALRPRLEAGQPGIRTRQRGGVARGL